MNVKENYIEFVNPPVDQFKEFTIDILGQGYVDREKGTSSIQADVAFGTRRDRLLSYETWLESDKGKENREFRDFVRQAKERLEAESGGDGGNKAKNGASSQVNGGGNDGDNGNGGPYNGKPKSFSDAYQNPSALDERAKAYKKAEETYQSNQQLLKDAAPNKKGVLSVVTMYREVVGQNKNHLNRVARGNAATLDGQVGRTSYVRNGSQVSSNSIFNLQENHRAVNSARDERTKAYRKAEETYRSNQQLLKAAAPNRKVNLNAATDYADAEAEPHRELS